MKSLALREELGPVFIVHTPLSDLLNNWLMTLVRKSLGEGLCFAVSSYRWSICWGVCPAARIRANLSPFPLSRLLKTIAPASCSSSSGEAVALLSLRRVSFTLGIAAGFFFTCVVSSTLAAGRLEAAGSVQGRDTHTHKVIDHDRSFTLSNQESCEQQRFDFKVQGHQQKVSRLSSGSNKTFQGRCPITT